MILPVVLYGCEIWSLTIREEQRLRVIENRMLRRIFGPRSDEVTGGWRKLHNGELNNLYPSTSIITLIRYRRIRLEGHVPRMGGKRNSYSLLVVNPDEMRPLEISRRRWVDNIKVDLGEIRWGGVGCIGLTQDRDKWRALVNSVMNLRVA
jgi:hypothetical protein